MISNSIVKSYYDFLGVKVNEFESGIRIFKSKNRDILINNVVPQQVILSMFNDEFILSVAPEIYNEHFEVIKKSGIVSALKEKNEEKCIKVLDGLFELLFGNYSITHSSRLVRNSAIDLNRLIKDNDQIELLEEKHYDNYLRTIKEDSEDMSQEEFNVIWSMKANVISEKKQYIALDSETVAGYCKVSDVIKDMANLVAYTSEYKRNHGYGKKVVATMANRCLSKGFIPMWWVDEDNLPSKALGKSLGFDLLAKEIIVKINY